MCIEHAVITNIRRNGLVMHIILCMLVNVTCEIRCYLFRAGNNYVYTLIHTYL